ncbi:SDR family oxidoreductase [Mycobacterium sp. SMC-14]|uniref:SDR family oxidoreductase n=1 Tax=Mycobacterium sp. SMC-14 TaxID=3385968 RepID=UPI00390C70A0
MVLRREASTLEGRVAVITGGGSGIGRGIVETFAEFGARVVIWERDTQAARATAKLVGGHACAIDVRDPDQVDAALAETLATVGLPTVFAGAAVFLAGSLSSYVTGQALHVDGGTHAAGGWYHHPDNGDYILGPSRPTTT